MELVHVEDPEDVRVSDDQADEGRLNRAAQLEFQQVGTALETLKEEMVDVPTNVRAPQYQLFCDDLQENHRRVARHTTPLLSTGNILF